MCGLWMEAMVWGYAFAIAAKKCKFTVVNAAAVSTTHWMAGQLPQTRADPNCKVMCGNTAWIGIGRMQREGGVMLNMGTGKLSMKIWALPTLAVLAVTKDVVLLVKAPSIEDMARTVSEYFF